jgi:hypothetical protein
MAGVLRLHPQLPTTWASRAESHLKAVGKKPTSAAQSWIGPSVVKSRPTRSGWRPAAGSGSVVDSHRRA